MRQIIIKCDRCGGVIEYDPYKIRFFTEDRNPTGDMDCIRTGCDRLELCQNCVEELMYQIEQFMQPDEARPEPEAEPEEKPAEEPEPETGGAEPQQEPPKYRGKIDAGRVRALYEAGWSVKEIAGEFGVSEQTVYNWLKQLKLK